MLQWNHRLASLVVLAATVAAVAGQGFWLLHLGW
jgi:hypothetical protein